VSFVEWIGKKVIVTIRKGLGKNKRITEHKGVIIFFRQGVSDFVRIRILTDSNKIYQFHTRLKNITLLEE